MARWIDADALINDLEHDIAIDEDILAYVGTDQITRTTTQFDKDCKQNAIDLLIHAPSIDIEPKRGEWIPCSKEGLALTELMRREGRKWYGYKCSNCNFIYKGNALLEFNFCPNCGADMREREGE